MEATKIDQLFPDALEEIFSHLNASDLKNCALVCKDWDDLIGSHAVTMKKLQIGFRLYQDDISFVCSHREIMIMQSSDESYRKHRNVEIFILDGSLSQLSSLDRFIISQAKSLSLHLMSSAIEFNKVVELLSRMPLLKVLTIHFGAKCKIDTSNTPVAHFNKLKQLNVHSSCDQPITGILDSVKANNVIELTYHAYAVHSDVKIDAVADFIKFKSNGSFAKLNISSKVFNQLHRRHDFCGMNLESLSVEAPVRVDQSGIVMENFRKSLIANAHSLTSLSIPPWLLTKEAREVIFNRLGKLTTLQIIGYDAGSCMDNLSPNDISHNSPLKILKVFHVGAIGGLRAILQRAPQLKKLSLGRVADAIMKEVAASAPGLVDLEIYTLKSLTVGVISCIAA